MRINEVLTRVDEDELIDIRCKSWNFCIQGTKWEITHSDTFMDNHFGDMLVTHIEVNDSPRGHAIMLLADSGESIRGFFNRSIKDGSLEGFKYAKGTIEKI